MCIRDSSGDRVVIVKVNPKDVVSVPTDCECQKVRTCEYQVIADYEGPLQSIVHHSEDGKAWTEDEFAHFMNGLMGSEDGEEYGEQEGFDADLN